MKSLLVAVATAAVVAVWSQNVKAEILTTIEPVLSTNVSQKV